uniref:Ig-like domain-containing protein n=1 Tax=Rhabditophanes sp. KR3021 TaxID=114890 RepID=A0AC35TWN4_9BILA
MFVRTLVGVLTLSLLAKAQQTTNVPQVKISDQPFMVTTTDQLNTIKWTMLGTTASETVYCVSEHPVSQLRFVCVECLQNNITDIVNILNSAQDLTRKSGFPTIALQNVPARPNWTGVKIVCQATLNGGTIDSAPAEVNVRYLRQPHVVDRNGMGPVLIANQGYRFYVECIRGQDGQCQQSVGRGKTLRCAVEAHPPPTVFKWFKNGVEISGNSAEITIGVEMIRQSIQCSANNGLHTDFDMPQSQAVQIDPYTAAHVLLDNFANIQNTSPFQPGNRIDMNQVVNLGCQVEGNPRPIVFWKQRKTNGEIVDAPCPQGFDGNYQETANDATRDGSFTNNAVKLNAVCNLHISNYSLSGQYWCSACSYVSQGSPECSPSADALANSVLNIQVQGPPTPSEQLPTVQKSQNGEDVVITVHYCSDPMPRPPREVIFSIDQNDIQVGQSWQNFRFEGTTQNNTVPNCYFARLQINPIRDSDERRTIVLKVHNQYGKIQIPVSLGSLLGSGSGFSKGISDWIVIIIVIIAIIVTAIIAGAICLKKQIFCFNKVKNVNDKYSRENNKQSRIPSQDNYPDTNSVPHNFLGTATGEVIRARSPSDNGIYNDYDDFQITNHKQPSVYLSREAVV